MSIATTLDMPAKNFHVPASRIKEIVGNDVWQDYLKFSFVRNPFDKLVSQYFFNREKFGLRNLSFKQYVKYYKDGGQISTFDPKNVNFIDMSIDFIGKFETLQQDFDTLCDKLGIFRRKLPHINKTNHKNYTEYYDDETREIVTELFEQDLAKYKYTFHGQTR